MPKTLRIILALIFALLPQFQAQAQSTFSGRHFDAQIVSKSVTAKAGTPLEFAVAIKLKPGWHIYWSNPGESGYPPRLNWTLPEGFKAGEIRHPVPQLLTVLGISSNVHEGSPTLLQTLMAPTSITPGAIKFRLELDLLVCTKSVCVPDQASGEALLEVGDGAPNATSQSLFARAEAALPVQSKGIAKIAIEGDKAKIFLPAVTIAPGAEAHVFGAVPTALADKENQSFSAVDGGTLVTIAKGSAPITDKLPIVLRLANGSSVTGLAFAAEKVATLSSDGAGGFSAFLAAFGAALLGGLILNLMPCVFPILSLKALALARAGGNERSARSEALGYSVGAIGVVLIFGAALIMLRNSGTMLGWAFQLQDARVVALLLLLVTAIALNLAGLFDVPSLSVSGTGAGPSGFTGSISTGALAAFIATPCTGPFMAGALGAALVLPTIAALAVFLGLGIGLALPFLVIGFWPRARQWLPKPGAWMERLRHILSIPMFITALGLTWIVGRQTGANGMAMALAAALILGLGLWVYGRRIQSGKRGLAVVLPIALSIGTALSVTTFGQTPSSQPADDKSIVNFSAQKLADLRGAGKPVFLYMTADWCLSCKVNEATSLANDGVQSAFEKAGVTVMRGDWTNGDPEISAYLKENGKAGVPVYYWYPANGEPREMPQILTPSMLTALVSP